MADDAVFQWLKERVEALSSSTASRPSLLPKVALELLQLSQQEEVDISDVVQVVEGDPLVTGKLLALTRSAFYAGAVPIRSVRQAVMRLGLNTLRDLVMEIALGIQVFVAPGYSQSMERLRRHSVMCAHLTRVVCLHARIEGGSSYLAALLHDVGVAACLIALAEEPRRAPNWKLQEVLPALGALHESAGLLLVKPWGLPDEITGVMECHHELEREPIETPLSAVITLAQLLAEDLGATLLSPQDESHLPPDSLDVFRVSPSAAQHALQVLGLKEKSLATLRHEAKSIAQMEAQAH